MMLSDKEEKIIGDLRMDFKVKWMEHIMKKFFIESLEAFYLKLKYQSEETKPLLTISDLAFRFKVSKTTIHNWLRRGIIKGSKIGKNRYFSEKEIQDLIHFLEH